MEKENKEMKKKESEFDKKKGTIETLFTIFCVGNIISFLLDYFVFKSIDFSKTAGISTAITYTLVIVFTFVTALLAHKEKISAGILGIIVACVEIILGSVIEKVLGICILIDSIMYITKYKK